MSRLRDSRRAGSRAVTRCALRGCALAVVLSSCGSWRGIANVPLPGGPGTGGDKMTIYVQMPDTLALNVNSRVRVADVFVGSVRTIELKNWVATLTLDVQSSLELPSTRWPRSVKPACSARSTWSWTRRRIRRRSC